MRGAESKGKGGCAIGMAVWCGVGAIVDISGVGCRAVDGVEIFADVASDGDEELARFEGGGEAREEFAFEGGGEGAEFDAGAEFAVEEVAEADARAGVVEGDFTAEVEARSELGELVGGGGVAEAEDFARQK